MPRRRRNYRRSYRTKSKKRSRRRRKRRRPIVSLQRSRLVSDTMYVKLVYPTGLSISSGVGSAFRVFRGNSCFDPDQTGTGSQPLGYDEWAGLFANYRVTASSIKAMMHVDTPNTSTGVMALILPIKDLSKTGSSYADNIGNPQVRRKLVSGVDNGFRNVLSNYTTTRKEFGLTTAQFGSPDYSAPVASNPQEEFYWLFQLGDLTGASSTVSQDVYFELTYYVEFFNRKDLARS